MKAGISSLVVWSLLYCGVVCGGFIEQENQMKGFL